MISVPMQHITNEYVCNHKKNDCSGIHGCRDERYESNYCVLNELSSSELDKI
jgi:hypothetical protein